MRDLRGPQAAEQHIRFLAHHDALTGLPNRASFNARLDDEIAQADRRDSPLRCCVSTSTASRRSTICSATRPATRCCSAWRPRSRRCSNADQFAARLGGDEFAVILPDINAMAQSGALCRATARRLPQRQTNAAVDGTVISASIGIAHLSRRRRGWRAADELRRHRALSRQAGWARHLPVFRSADGCANCATAGCSSTICAMRFRATNSAWSISPRSISPPAEVTGFEALVRWRHRGARRYCAERIHSRCRRERADPPDR